MNEEEKFVFDLEGYLVIKDVLSPQELDDLNALMDGTSTAGTTTPAMT